MPIPPPNTVSGPIILGDTSHNYQITHATNLVTTHELYISHITTRTTTHAVTRVTTQKETHAATQDFLSVHSGINLGPVCNLISVVNGQLKDFLFCPGYHLKLIIDCTIDFSFNWKLICSSCEKRLSPFEIK